MIYCSYINRNVLKGEFSMKKNKGFTLAEVLVTLSILGIVAVLTVPGIIRHYKKVVTQTKLKLMYSQLSSAIDQMNIEYQPISKIVDEAFNENSSYLDKIDYFSNNYLGKYIQYTVSCDTSDWVCRRDNFNYDIIPFDSDTPSSAAVFGNGIHRYKLKNGINLFVAYSGSGTTFFLIVDTNGDKKPNKIGYDIFYFAVHGTASDLNKENSLDCGQSNNYSMDYTKKVSCASQHGIGCTCPIMLNNFKFPDDYPVKF